MVVGEHVGWDGVVIGMGWDGHGHGKRMEVAFERVHSIAFGVVHMVCFGCRFMLAWRLSEKEDHCVSDCLI